MSSLSDHRVDLETLWEQIDAILVINLATRTDRWQNFCARNADLLPMEKVRRIEAVVGTELPGYGQAPWFREQTQNRATVWGGVAGCALSHRLALECVVENGWKHALILEDDVALAESDQWEALPQALASLQEPAFLYLGYHQRKPYGHRRGVFGATTLWTLDGVLAAHAYIVSAASARAVLPLMPTRENVWEWVAQYRAVDTMYRDYLKARAGVRAYALWPVLISQAGDSSDIGTGSKGTSVAHDSFVAGKPISYASFAGLLRLVQNPLLRFKILMNARRTLFRARQKGLPGYKNRS